jgi:DNA-directed RNA polymerase specialized sigma24 family protein
VNVNDGAVPSSPEPGRPREVPDAELAAELKKSGGEGPVHRPVEELLARHGEAVYAYARLCTAGAHPAGMLTTAAFTRLFENAGRQAGPTAAWRPALLVTVGRIAAEWDADHRRDMLHAELRSGTGSGSAAARLLPPGNRRLVTTAFQRLAEPARCLLWHMEVEREEPDVPAALLGIDVGDVPVRLARARARLRDACLEVHRESAPRDDCRRFARLLDVALRRGDRVLDPDLLFHLDGCAHCRGAAEQLDGFDRRLPVLLTEGVLGWAARAYLDTRGPREPEPPRGPTALDARMDFTAPDTPPVPPGPRTRAARPRTPVRTAAAHVRTLTARLRTPRRPSTPADPKEGPPPGAPSDDPAARSTDRSAVAPGVAERGAVGRSAVTPGGAARGTAASADAGRGATASAVPGREAVVPGVAERAAVGRGAAAAGGAGRSVGAPSHAESGGVAPGGAGRGAVAPGVVGSGSVAASAPAPGDGAAVVAAGQGVARPEGAGHRRAGRRRRAGAAVAGSAAPAAAREDSTGTAPGAPVAGVDARRETASDAGWARGRVAAGAVGWDGFPGAAARHRARGRMPRAVRWGSSEVGARREPLLVVGIVGACVVVPLAVWGVMGGGGGAAEEPGGTASSVPSWAGTAADASDGVVRGRLRNAGDGLCLDVHGEKAVAGAEAVLAGCGFARTQHWAYETDGLLRSLAEPSLCLDSRLGYSVVLAPCAGRSTPEARNVRYDFTLQGTLVPRRDQNLALAPAAPGADPAPGTALVLKPRATGDGEQRWQADTDSALRMQSVNWGAEGTPTDR